MSIVALGVVAAVLYGVSDVLARFAADAVGPLRMMLFAQAAILVLFATAYAIGVLAPPPVAIPGVWLAAAANDLAILAATALFYRAVAVGSLAVVVPIANSHGAVTALMSAALGEPISPWCMVGILVTVIGGAIVATPPRTEGEPVPRRRGVVSVVASALLFGSALCVQGRYVVPVLGPVAPLALYYLLGVPVLVATALIVGRSLVVPPPRQWPAVIGTAGLTLVAAAVVAVAAARGAVAVPAGLTALSSLVAALLARALFGERVAPRQWVGIVLSVLGSAIVNASG